LDPSDLERDGLLNTEIGNPCPNHPSDNYSIGYLVLLKRDSILDPSESAINFEEVKEPRSIARVEAFDMGYIDSKPEDPDY